MGTLWLSAVAIDEVRDIFGAPQAEAEALRAIAAERFGRPHDTRTGLLGKLGPVFRRPVDAPVVGPDLPAKEDVDRILAGQHVPPHRLAASWRLLQAWIEARAWSTYSLAVDEHTLTAVEFDLARSGVPARHGVRALLARDLGTGLLPAPRMVAGYCANDQAVAAAQSWAEVLPELEPATAAWVGELLGWLARFPEWTAAAADSGRRAPDLVSVLTA